MESILYKYGSGIYITTLQCHCLSQRQTAVCVVFAKLKQIEQRRCEFVFTSLHRNVKQFSLTLTNWLGHCINKFDDDWVCTCYSTGKVCCINTISVNYAFMARARSWSRYVATAWACSSMVGGLGWSELCVVNTVSARLLVLCLCPSSVEREPVSNHSSCETLLFRSVYVGILLQVCSQSTSVVWKAANEL